MINYWKWLRTNQIQCVLVIQIHSYQLLAQQESLWASPPQASVPLLGHDWPTSSDKHPLPLLWRMHFARVLNLVLSFWAFWILQGIHRWLISEVKGFYSGLSSLLHWQPTQGEEGWNTPANVIKENRHIRFCKQMQSYGKKTFDEVHFMYPIYETS